MGSSPHRNLKTFNGFAAWLQYHGYAPNTIRVYVGTIRSLAKILRYIHKLAVYESSSSNTCKQGAFVDAGWGRGFVAAMGKLMCRSVAASILQSGLSTSDLLALTYSDIK